MMGDTTMAVSLSTAATPTPTVAVGRQLGAQGDPDMKGWLFKWTNYLKGYQRRWFVLQNGLLSYYRAEHNGGGVSTLSIRRRRRFRSHGGNQAEMSHTCRGSISLHGAIIYPVDACTFVVSNGGTQTFHIRAASEVERQCWVTALELAKAKAIRTIESEDDDDEQDSGSGSPEEWSIIVRELQGKLQDLQTCSDLIAKHGNALQRALSELESNAEQNSDETKSKAVSERATLFRIASNAMINACTEYLTVAQQHGHKWTRLLQHEREQRQRLEEMVETLAQQHSKLEQAAAANANNRNTKAPRRSLFVISYPAPPLQPVVISRKFQTPQEPLTSSVFGKTPPSTPPTPPPSPSKSPLLTPHSLASSPPTVVSGPSPPILSPTQPRFFRPFFVPSSPSTSPLPPTPPSTPRLLSPVFGTSPSAASTKSPILTPRPVTPSLFTTSAEPVNPNITSPITSLSTSEHISYTREVLFEVYESYVDQPDRKYTLLHSHKQLQSSATRLVLIVKQRALLIDGGVQGPQSIRAIPIRFSEGATDNYIARPPRADRGVSTHGYQDQSRFTPKVKLGSTTPSSTEFIRRPQSKYEAIREELHQDSSASPPHSAHSSENRVRRRIPSISLETKTLKPSVKDSIEEPTAATETSNVGSPKHSSVHVVDPVSASEEDEEENEFYDAEADGASLNQERFTLNIPTGGGRRNSSDSSSETDDTTHETKQVVIRTSNVSNTSTNNANTTTGSSSNPLVSMKGRMRRTTVPNKPNYPLNLWSIMKNCIGKDLSKIPMPVNFSEPLSMLQRLAEDFEYADLLDMAATIKDPCEQLAYVAAFTISSYSTTSTRVGKPFNPLLGETFEFDRTHDLGWKLISEQVSHHPPMVAQHCEGRGWTCWQEFTMTSKFRGKYLQVVPLGTAHVVFENGNRYSWRKVTTTVHNIIVGKLWVDQHGDMEITGKGNAAGIKCHLKFIPYSYFSKESQRRVKGAVLDESDKAQWIINGTWDRSVEIAPVLNQEHPPAQSARSRHHMAKDKSMTTIYDTGPAKLAWQRIDPPVDCEKCYHFTTLAIELNEMEEGVAPTDSRMRPDQRLMENQRWDEANSEKLRLEEKQRAVRRKREKEAEEAAKEGRPYTPYTPLWFKQVKDENDCIVHSYLGTYWEAKKKQEWSHCPDIF